MIVVIIMDKLFNKLKIKPKNKELYKNAFLSLNAILALLTIPFSLMVIGNKYCNTFLFIVVVCLTGLTCSNVACLIRYLSPPYGEYQPIFVIGMVLVIFIVSGVKIIRPYQNGLVEKTW